MAKSQRLKAERKRKKRKIESPSSTGTADVIVVGGVPAEGPGTRTKIGPRRRGRSKYNRRHFCAQTSFSTAPCGSAAALSSASTYNRRREARTRLRTLMVSQRRCLCGTSFAKPLAGAGKSGQTVSLTKSRTGQGYSPAIIPEHTAAA